MLSIIILIFVYLLNNSVLSLSTNSQLLNIHIDYSENDTIILSYNLTTNYSYYITFRSFGNEQFKFGLFSITTINQYDERSIEIFYPYSTTEVFYLFVICFHFMSSIKNLDIQCKDIRLLKENQLKTNITQDFLPSYNPLFVPMMYALSVIMLLPVIIQHHRRKQAKLLQRRKELRRLSVTIAQDQGNPRQNVAQKLLSQIIENENENLNYDHIPLNLQLTSAPSTKTILEDIDDNTNVQFTLDSLHPVIQQYEDNEQSTIDAHDCIAHLLNNTPWNTLYSEQPFGSNASRRHSVVRDSAIAIKEQYVPTIIAIPDHDDDDDRKPILRVKKSSTPSFYRSNRTFFESDV